MTIESHRIGVLATRGASPSDAEWLYRLRTATMSEHFEKSGHILSPEQQRDRLMQSYPAIRIIQMDGVDIGMMKVVRESNVWQLVQIQLLPRHQREGIGTFMIENLLAEARAAGVAVSLHALKVNPAVELYKRLGFTVVAEGDHSYEMRAGI